MGYIKSPLNYTGGKYKLLPYIVDKLPKDMEINTLVDLFCGGCNVAVNISAKQKVCNDIESHVIDFYNGVHSLTGEEAQAEILKIVTKYDLSKTNQEGFLKCREDYNKDKIWQMFYAVISHAFNYQIRYNSSGDYNMPFGKDRSSFNPVLQANLKAFVDELNKGVYKFTNVDFRGLNELTELSENDFVYADPPYLASTVVYGKENAWTEKDEYELLALLDNLNDRNVKFMLSNVLENKGKSNDILKEWSKKYIVHDLNYTYANCSYHVKDKTTNTTKEVIITNY